MSKYITASVLCLADPITGQLLGFLGPDGKEYLLPVAVSNASGTPGVTSGISQLLVQTGIGAPLALTNPIIQSVNIVNNYTQDGIQNLHGGVNASADFIAYPNNNSSDGTGFCDMGITSSGFAQAAYSITGPNDPYLFGSSPTPNATASGDLVIATDANGVSNGIRFYTNGFNKAITAWALKILGSGLTAIGQGWALANNSKIVVNNAALTTYTIPAASSYIYVTSSAASLAITYPAASVAIDGLMISIVLAAGMLTTTYISTGATFVGAPTTLVANTPLRMIYHHATLQWLPV